MKKISTFFRTISLLFILSISLTAYNQAPVWIWNSPLAVIPSTVGGAGLSIYAMLDRPGTIYYVVVPHGAPPLTNTNIINGTDSAGLTPTAHSTISIGATDYKGGYKTIEIKPLTSSTEFDVYLLAKDTATIPHYQAVYTKLDLTTTPGTGLTYWNSGFEVWNDSLTFPIYYFNQRQLLPNYQTYSRTAGESGYGIKTTVTNTSIAEKRILVMNPDPFPFGLNNNTKYHVSIRLKASRANAFSVTYNAWSFLIDFASNNSYGSPSPNSPTNNVYTAIDTLKDTNWTTYSADFTMASGNRFKPRWNVNKTASVQVGDNLTLDNFYIKNATEAPLWWNGNPAISNVKFNKFDVSLQLDEPATVYYVLVLKDATPPSVAEVLAGTAAGGTTAILNGSIGAAVGFNTYSTTLSGLAENKNYDLFLVAQNKESSPTAQSSVTKVSALTTSFPGPFAKAGGKIRAISGYTVNLDGTGSIGTGLKYNWSAPAGILLSDSTVSKPTFIAPSTPDSSVYSIILVVKDSINTSSPDTVFVHVIHDYIPIANGGGNKTAAPNTNVSLDGSQSRDPNGNNLTYSWTIPTGITVNKTDTAVISFLTPSPLVNTDYKFVLVVNDGKLNSNPDTVVLTVSKFNLPPNADAGNGKTVDPATQVVLDGSASTDPNGDKLTYHWTVPAGISVSNVDTAVITFVAPSPDVKTSYKFFLVVNDGQLNSNPDTLILTVNAVHHKPTVNAGIDQTVNAGVLVTLTGSYSADSTGIPPMYSWTIPNGITVNKADTFQISFTAPSPANTTLYTFILVVNDGIVNSNPDTVVVTVLGTTGIRNSVVQDVQLYPNPVSSSLNISLSSNWNFNSTVIIYNALGSILMERKMDGHEYLLDMSSLSSGIYIIEIKDGQNSVSRKLIKR
jgi:hypothetical protein